MSLRPETKQQAVEWRHSGSLRSKIFRLQKFAVKFTPRIFFRTIRHSSLLLSSKGPNYQRGDLLISAGQLKDILKDKRRGKFTKAVLFLNDNSPGHRVLASQKKLAYLGFQCLDHPPYSPDLTPSDYHLFAGLKNQLKGHHFLSDEEVIAAAETWLDGQTSEFF